LNTIRGDLIEMRSIEWLDKPLLQGSAFHLIAGPKGVGKGTWTARMIAAMTQGIYGTRKDVLIVSSEDSASIDLKPRLVAAGADHTGWRLIIENILLPRDLYRLEDLATETTNVGMVGMIVIDPVGNHLGGADTDKESAVRFAIGGLNKLADDEDDMVFHVQVVAGNRSGRSAAESYRIELRDVGLKEPVTYAVALGESLKNVDELLALPRRASKSVAARDLILDILEAEGEQESDVFDARVAQETGLTAKTVRNQRAELKNAGLVKSIPVTEEGVEGVARWKVARTAAPRSGGVTE
jgi:hypothetical protein